MKISQGKLIKSGELGAATPLVVEAALEGPAVASPPRGRVVGSAVLEAAERAREIIARAEQQASRIVARAEAGAAELKLRAEAEGRADAAAALAARILLLKAREAEASERALDQVVELARMLAERLLGETLELAPERIVAIARQALAEARGAKRVSIVAHPEDAARLELALRELGMAEGVARVVADPRRERNSLRLETDIGTLDAGIGPQLERLTLKLRETLRHGT